MGSHTFVLKQKLRRIKLDVLGAPGRMIRTRSYPVFNNKFYELPTYTIEVSGTDESGSSCQKSWECYRFGIYNNDGSDPSHSARGLFVAGLADKQKYTILKFDPTYDVHSSPSQELGAWHVTGGFFIHDGPDDPVKEKMFASIGCIEICGAPQGFNAFNDFIIQLSGTSKTGPDALVEIGQRGLIEIEYHQTPRPPLKEAP